MSENIIAVIEIALLSLSTIVYFRGNICTMSIGENIKKLRELKNFTQQYVADQLNLSLSGYGKIERNETDISISRLNEIASVLGVDVNTILSFDEKHVFNMSNNQSANGIVYNQIELIEKMMEQFRDENKYLRDLVMELSKR